MLSEGKDGKEGEFLDTKERCSVDTALRSSIKHALKHMQLCPVDVSPIYTGKKFILLKILLVFDTNTTEIRGLTLEKKPETIAIKLGESSRRDLFGQ